MVGTRKSDTLGTSYSQTTAQQMWEREAEEEASSSGDLPPLSMADGNHLRLQLGEDGDSEEQLYPDMPPLLAGHSHNDDSDDEEEEVEEREIEFNNPSRLLNELPLRSKWILNDLRS